MAAMLIFVVGCGQQEETTVTTGGTSFIGGSDGLSLEFMEGAPPAEVYDANFPFSVNVKVENIGEWDVAKEDISVKITGIDPADFGSPELLKQPLDDLNGAQKDPQGNIIQGTISNLDFSGFQYEGTVSGSVQFNIRAETCYEYGTRAQSQVCIKKDFLGTTGEAGLCEASEAKPADNSGAPVQVEKLTESVMARNKISFLFDIAHIGTGTIHEMGTSCNTTMVKKNRVWVNVTDPALGIIECSGLDAGSTATEGFVTLYNDMRSIRCTLTIDDANLDDYVKVINMELKYGYKEHTDTPLVVKHASVD